MHVINLPTNWSLKNDVELSYQPAVGGVQQKVTSYMMLIKSVMCEQKGLKEDSQLRYLHIYKNLRNAAAKETGLKPTNLPTKTQDTSSSLLRRLSGVTVDAGWC